MNDIINTLRNVRGADDIIERLKASSLEARSERLAEALKSDKFEHGPADLVATYPKHVLANKDGVLMRVSLDESEDSIKFGKVEIYDVPVAPQSLAEEIIESAKVAVDSILSEDSETSTTIIASIARALDIKGDVAKQIESNVRLSSLKRDQWWNGVVAENYQGSEISIPQPHQTTDTINESQALQLSISDLLSLIVKESKNISESLKVLENKKDTHPIFLECAKDILEDLKNAILALKEVNINNLQEMKSTYEVVGLVAPRLLMGTNFLSHLAK